jgi:hypothetical protein
MKTLSRLGQMLGAVASRRKSRAERHVLGGDSESNGAEA